MVDNICTQAHSCIMNKPFDTFRALGEENRFRITALLARTKGEICACEIIRALGKPQYTVSKSMGGLVTAGLVEERRDGQKMFYRLRLEDPTVKILADAVTTMTKGKGYIWKDDLK